MELNSLSGNFEDIFSSFRWVLEKIANHLNKHDLMIKPYHSSKMKAFRGLSKEIQVITLNEACDYLSTLEEAECHSNWSFKDDTHFLWISLKKLQLTPTSDILSHIKTGDAVEIYSASGIQVWRNLGFMEVCSYTLEEVFCYTWEERYVRNDKAMEQMKEIIAEIFQQERYKTTSFDVKNELIEKFSEKQYRIDVYHKVGCPLLNSDREIVGFIIVSGVKLLLQEQKKEKNIPTLRIVPAT